MESKAGHPDPRQAPAGLDERIEWFDRLGAELVHLAPYPLPDLHRALATFEAAVRAHLSRQDWGPSTALETERVPPSRLLENEHIRFVTSLEQLWWLYEIVERDDHGGHRQALGQYMRIFAEALRRHRDDERSPVSPPAARKSPGSRSAASGNAN